MDRLYFVIVGERPDPYHPEPSDGEGGGCSNQPAAEPASGAGEPSKGEDLRDAW